MWGKAVLFFKRLENRLMRVLCEAMIDFTAPPHISTIRVVRSTTTRRNDALVDTSFICTILPTSKGWHQWHVTAIGSGYEYESHGYAGSWETAWNFIQAEIQAAKIPASPTE